MFLSSYQDEVPQPVTRLSAVNVLSIPRRSPFTSLQFSERPQILLLTEDAQVVQWVRNSLEPELGITVAPTWTEGFSLLNSHCPDLILCDLESSLDSLCEHLKQAEFCDVPLLLLTSWEDRKKKSAWLQDRATDLLAKPCEPEELKARVGGHLQAFLAKRALEEELMQKGQPLDQMAHELVQKTRELHRTNRMKDEFMAVLSHELRNPINVIAGFAEILKSGWEQPELAREAAEAIYRNAQVQIKLVTDLLDISRGIAGKLILDTRPLGIGMVLKEILPTAREAALKKGISLSVQESCLRDMVEGDAIRISQVIWNLLSNAIKFTPQGGRIEVLLSNQDNWVELSVKDTGHGINPQFLPHMFERFNQQDASITKNFGGLGLGLAIVRHIVELHGGTVSAHSEGHGSGATFTVRFPSLPN